MVTKVTGKRHPKHEVLVAVKSRQVSEVRKKKFGKATSVPGGGKGETSSKSVSDSPVFVALPARNRGGWGVGGGHLRLSLPTSSREERA